MLRQLNPPFAIFRGFAALGKGFLLQTFYYTISRCPCYSENTLAFSSIRAASGLGERGRGQSHFAGLTVTRSLLSADFPDLPPFRQNK